MAACGVASPCLGSTRLTRPSTRRTVAARARPAKGKQAAKQQPADAVDYGESWYETTRRLSGKQGRTVREELEYRRAANLAANNGKERKDLYTDNWDGSEWKGGGFNILTLLVGLFVLVPIAGLAFAFLTYGELWG